MKLYNKKCLVLSFFLFLVFYSQINSQPPLKTSLLYAQQIDKEPAFQDSYWTDKTVAAGDDANKLNEKEVGPSEGTSTLAIVLVNKAQSDIYAIKGNLHLPPGFDVINQPANEIDNNLTNVQNNSNSLNNENSTSIVNNIDSINSESGSKIAGASYDSIVKPGEEFTLYFDINIKENANLGMHSVTLDLVYSKVLTTGDIIVKNIPISFRISGKVIFDIESKDQYLSPGQVNEVTLNIINRGSADADGVIISISTSPNDQGSDLSPVSESTVRDNSSILNIDDANQNNSNNSNEGQSNVGNTTYLSISAIGTQKFSIDKISAGQGVLIETNIYAAINSAESLRQLNVEITYSNPIGNRVTDNFNVGLIINAEPDDSNIEIDILEIGNNNLYRTEEIFLEGSGSSSLSSTNNVITAGSIEDVRIQLTKVPFGEIKDVVITIFPSSESVQVLGNSRWAIDILDSNMIELETKIFVSEDLIGKPINLDFDIDYLLNGIKKSESINLGLYVNGKIAIRAYDFQLNVIGDEPNLVSNLLNEGNTDALFTTAELISPSEFFSINGIKTQNSENISSLLFTEYPPIQYLGDLAENSPLPISIPIKISNSTQSGVYPIFIKISYKDNLRNENQLFVNGTVEYVPEIKENNGDSGFFTNNYLFPLIIGIGISIALVIIIKRKSNNNKKQKLKRISNDPSNIDDDLDSVLSDK